MDNLTTSQRVKWRRAIETRARHPRCGGVRERYDAMRARIDWQTLCPHRTLICQRQDAAFSPWWYGCLDCANILADTEIPTTGTRSLVLVTEDEFSFLDSFSGYMYGPDEWPDWLPGTGR